MDFDEVLELACQLPRNDRFRLIQTLIKFSAQEEAESPDSPPLDIQYIIERINKNQPASYKSLANFIKSMFQFKGGVKDEAIDSLIQEIVDKKIIKINGTKITYPNTPPRAVAGNQKNQKPTNKPDQSNRWTPKKIVVEDAR
ncbi:MAG: hypothetical protein LBT47_03975 [Deltaproteobacteria bacterium]|jgi:hypothetical protein|nr:hypothetical protein [Deltaproteobacteria bacterium]